MAFKLIYIYILFISYYFIIYIFCIFFYFVYVYIYIYIYIYIYVNSQCQYQYMKNKTFITSRVIFQFLLSRQRFGRKRNITHEVINVLFLIYNFIEG